MVGAHSTTENNFITLSLSFRKQLNSMYKKRLPVTDPSRLLLPASQDDYPRTPSNHRLLPASTAITAHGDYTDAWVRQVYSILAVWGLGLDTARSMKTRDAHLS